MKKNILYLILLLALLLAAAGGYWLWQNLQGAGPAISPPAGDIADMIGGTPTTGVNKTDFPLQLPPGFAISVYADNVPDARVMVFDGLNNMWVSQPKQGRVSLVSRNAEGNSRVDPIFQNLNNPHGIAVDPGEGLTLYIAEEHRISRVSLYTEGSLEKIIDLPEGGRHTTRTIAFGPDGRLYVSIGSTCDVCYEDDERHASIYSMNSDGSDFRKEAEGLRNAVFFDWSYVDGRMWATEMGRDHLGDNLPPDEINVIELGPGSSPGRVLSNNQMLPDFGWPICYGKNVHDTNFDPDASVGASKNPCEGKTPSHIDLQAHSAPLGLAFVPEEGWPEMYWYDLLVAYHGSRNRTEPTGYKIARIRLDAQGNHLGTEDFITGWLTEDGRALGRPVDIITQPGGIMFISDDKAGLIYKVQYAGEQEGSADIILDNLYNNQVIASGLAVEGEAKGTWFFEASFPIEIVDESGNHLGIVIAEAQDNWMTEDFVPFEAVLDFDPGQSERGEVIFKKDNPSGLSENEGEYRVQVRFGRENASPQTGGCIVTGCSGQICAEEETASTCEYREEYGCYREFGECTRLANGLCGWSPTEQLSQCLLQYK